MKTAIMEKNIVSGGITAGNLYNVDNITHPDYGFLRYFKDSAYGGVVLQQNLQVINPNVFTRKYPENTFLNIPNLTVDNTGGAADLITSLRVTGQGDFADETDRGDSVGEISIFGESSSIRVYERTAFGTWTKGELERANLQNIDLPSRILEATFFRYQRNLNDFCYVGNPKVGTTGVLNYSGFATSNYTWTGKTNKEKYQAISNLISDQWSATSNTPEYMATEVHLPTSIYNEIRKEWADDVLGETILYRLQKAYPEIRFINTYAAESVSGKKVICAFSPIMECMSLRIPTPLETGEVIRDGSSFKWRMDFRYRTGGIDILEDSCGQLLRLD